MTEGQALLHGDLHTGSLMCTETTTFAIDNEFAFYGPMGFDVGLFFANLLLAYFSQRGWADCKGEYRSTQGDWLLDTFNSTWAVFEKRFLEHWNEQGVRDDCGGLSPAILLLRASPTEASALKAHQGAYMKQIWEDSLGFAGAEMIRRIIGIAHVADLDEIPDADIRALSASGRSCVTRAHTQQRRSSRRRPSWTSSRAGNLQFCNLNLQCSVKQYKLQQICANY